MQVGEPSVEDTIQILAGIQPKYEEHHKVHYTKEAVEAAARLSHRYLTGRFLPDKAIDILDEAGARKRVSQMTDVYKRQAMNHFCREFGFRSISIQGISREDEGNSSQLASTLKKLRSAGVKALFPEYSSNPKKMCIRDRYLRRILSALFQKPAP